jgi:hypothetical protein
VPILCSPLRFGFIFEPADNFQDFPSGRDSYLRSARRLEHGTDLFLLRMNIPIGHRNRRMSGKICFSWLTFAKSRTDDRDEGSSPLFSPDFDRVGGSRHVCTAIRGNSQNAKIDPDCFRPPTHLRVSVKNFQIIGACQLWGAWPLSNSQ